MLSPLDPRVRPLRVAVCLAALALPAVAQTETLPNDLPLGTLAPGSSSATPRVAYNPVDEEYLVVWAETFQPGVFGGGVEIVGQRVGAKDGLPVGSKIAVSAMGAGGAGFAADPDVVYNYVRHEFLVVWSGTDVPSSADAEIRTQRIDAGLGIQVGLEDPRISALIPGLSNVGPQVAYAPSTDEYLVAWEQVGSTGATSSLRAQKLDGLGNEVGPDDAAVTLSGLRDLGGIAYGPAAHEFLAVWVAGSQVYGQRIDAATVTQVGPKEFQISDLAQTNPVLPLSSHLAHDPITDRFLVVWSGPDDPVDPEVREIHGRLVDADGTLVGPDEFAVSGLDHPLFYADPYAPRAVFQPSTNHYVVSWMGAVDGLVPGGTDGEVWFQVLDGTTGAEVGLDDLRLSDLGPEGDFDFGAGFPALALGPDLSALAVFSGYDQVGISAGGASQAFAQLLALPFPSTEIPRLGSPANPNVFAPGLTSGPVIGGTWDPVVDHSSFLPGAWLDVAVVSAGATQIPLDPATSLLVDLSAANYSFVAAPGAPFSIPIPALAVLAGVPAYAQAGSWDGTLVDLTNGLDLVFGTP